MNKWLSNTFKHTLG